jgi:hypothetical protein
LSFCTGDNFIEPVLTNLVGTYYDIFIPALYNRDWR